LAQNFAGTTAVHSGPTHFSVATVDPQGLPNLRMVLMKDYDQRGFVFYTNRQSAKGRDL
jgi:pyridoxamine 5'-phosphate oxidase